MLIHLSTFLLIRFPYRNEIIVRRRPNFLLKYVRAGVDMNKFARNNAIVLTSLMCDCSRPFWSVNSRTTARFCLSASRNWRSRLSSTACKSRRSACSSWHRCSHSARAWANCRRNRCRSCSISCKRQMTPDYIRGVAIIGQSKATPWDSRAREEGLGVLGLLFVYSSRTSDEQKENKVINCLLIFWCLFLFGLITFLGINFQIMNCWAIK